MLVSSGDRSTHSTPTSVSYNETDDRDDYSYTEQQEDVEEQEPAEAEDAPPSRVVCYATALFRSERASTGLSC